MSAQYEYQVQQVPRTLTPPGRQAESAFTEPGFAVMEPGFAVTEPGSGLNLAIDLAAVLSVHCHQSVDDTRNRAKARDDPTFGRGVDMQVFHLV